ncbi:MAG: lipoyl(octanoyl) transferase LipB [bacterium]|nr:lipoyl(octanoyl) transferase LipB [bacterium]
MLNTHRLGLVRYDAAYSLQRELWQRRVKNEIPDQLLLLEHEPVITLGRNSQVKHLLVKLDFLHERGIDVREVDRGGDVTYHGPGQLIGYPIINLSPTRMDVLLYLRDLEDVLIKVLAKFHILADRNAGRTGVWVGERKIASIGVKISRWVTYHGFALNVSTDLQAFEYIIPCGLSGVSMTTMSQEIGTMVEIADVAGAVELEMRRKFDPEFNATLLHLNRKKTRIGQSVSPIAQIL